MDKVTEITYEFFGKELGQKLLEEKQIVPHRWDNETKSYVPAAKWSHEDGHYCKKQTGNYKVLAVICGSTSDINVLDLDNLEYLDELAAELPDIPNFVGTNRGAHFYFHHQDSMPSVVKWTKDGKHIADYQSTAHLVKFSGQNKQGTCVFVDDWHETAITAFDRLFDRSGTRPVLPCDISKTYKSKPISEYLSVETYKCSSISAIHLWQDMQVGNWILDKDKDRIEQSFKTQLSKAKPGERNTKLNRIAFEAYRLDLDVEKLREAAYEMHGADWSTEEVDRVIDHAAGSFDDERSRTLDERVMVWHAIGYPQLKSRQTTVGKQVVDALAAMAVDTHSYRPAFNIERFANRTGCRIGTVSQKLQQLEKLGLVIKIPADRPKMANNYQLALKGEPIQDLATDIDQWLDDGQIDLLWHETDETGQPISELRYDPNRDPNHYGPDVAATQTPIPADPIRHREPEKPEEGKDIGSNNQKATEPTRAELTTVTTEFYLTAGQMLSEDWSKIEQQYLPEKYANRKDDVHRAVERFGKGKYNEKLVVLLESAGEKPTDDALANTELLERMTKV